MVKIKKAVLILGDVALLYVALALTLIFRYGSQNLAHSLNTHLKPFSVIFIIWILIFYLINLYELRKLRSAFELSKALALAVLLSAVISIILFYLFTGFFELTPKTNLGIFSIVFSILDFFWRLFVIKSGFAKTRLLILGESLANREIASYLEANPQIGYDIALWLKDLKDSNLDEFRKNIIERKIDIIVIPPQFIKKEQPLVKLIYALLPLNIEVINSSDFFEMVFQKIPLEELGEGWFIEKITTRRKVYDSLKRMADFLFGVIFFVIFSPIMFLNACLIKLTSPGPILYSQKRMGQNGRSFILHKFRTMRQEEGGALWTTENDHRITFVGKILRASHLDELPQLWNIIRGDISFIGPRAERLELAEYYSQLPYYEIRHIIKPGFTGWAQVNYRPSASLEEALEKLKYDIYYIKNRSLLLDLLIIIRTIILFFSSPK